MPTFLRSRARATGVLSAALLAVAATAGAADTTAAKDDRPPDSIINQESRADAEPSIVGGEPAEEGEFPFVAHLVVDDRWSCGGTLYARDLVLTAAHCVHGTGPTTDITATFGSVDLDSPDLVRYRSEYAYSANTSGIPNDWALIKLQEEVDGIDPLPVATTARFDVAEFTVIGWGDTEEGAGTGSPILQRATVPFVSDDDCAAAYGEEFTPDAEICAGYPDGGVDSCQGDSGGPMFGEDGDGGFVQVGIVSWGNGCAQPGFPGVYTQVSTFAEAIAAVASGGNTPAEVADVEVRTTIGTPVDIALTAQDAEGDDTAFKVTPPESGELTTDDDTLARLTYTPAPGFEGEDSFQFVANDGHTDSPPADVTIMVEGEAEPTGEPPPHRAGFQPLRDTPAATV